MGTNEYSKKLDKCSCSKIVMSYLCGQKTRKKAKTQNKENKLECFSRLKCLLNICRVKIPQEKNGQELKEEGRMRESVCRIY
jgi:ribosomal protein L5